MDCDVAVQTVHLIVCIGVVLVSRWFTLGMQPVVKIAGFYRHGLCTVKSDKNGNKNYNNWRVLVTLYSLTRRVHLVYMLAPVG